MRKEWHLHVTRNLVLFIYNKMLGRHYNHLPSMLVTALLPIKLWTAWM